MQTAVIYFAIEWHRRKNCINVYSEYVYCIQGVVEQLFEKSGYEKRKVLAAMAMTLLMLQKSIIICLVLLQIMGLLQERKLNLHVSY